MNGKIIGVNEKGRPVGESHHNAKLTDADCDLIRELHDDGISYRKLAEKFEVPRSTVVAIVKCRRRAQYAVRWRPGVRDEGVSQ